MGLALTFCRVFFIIQVKMSTFVQFQLKIDENNLNGDKKLTSFWGAKVLFKKIEFEQKDFLMVRP